MSPFSAVISLKKSFIKDKSGIPLNSPPRVPDTIVDRLKLDNLLLQESVARHEKAKDVLRSALEDAVSENENAHKTIYKLENELVVKSNKIEVVGRLNEKTRN